MNTNQSEYLVLTATNVCAQTAQGRGKRTKQLDGVDGANPAPALLPKLRYGPVMVGGIETRVVRNSGRPQTFSIS